jgi:hypothetical protein
VGIAGALEAAGGELRRAGAEHCALGDQQLLAPLAAEVGAAQLDAELGRAAGQDENLGAGVAVQRLAAKGRPSSAKRIGRAVRGTAPR